MIKTITIKTEDVCPKTIDCKYDDVNETVIEVKFNGGCSGNTQAISQLIKGMRISEVIEKLGKIKCGSKNTSCGKELCKGLIREIM